MFKSFFLAGFECATGYNLHREWIDQIECTQHDQQADEDYRRLQEVGLLAVREGIRWPRVDVGGKYDFNTVFPFLEAGWKHGIEIIWDLFHYGYPKEIDLFSEEFPRRFADYCHAVASFIRTHQDPPYYFTPVNEPSFFSWAAGDMGRFAPHCNGKGMEIKIALARAGIAGINAIRSVIPDARIINVDPVCNVVPPADNPGLLEETEHFNQSMVFESFDMLCGKKLPELGGSREHLDVVGINYYWTNQWEMGHDEHPLADDDPRRISLGNIVRRVANRYGGDILITETAHVEGMRPTWINYVADQVDELLQEGVPLRGVCLYPILSMPEWHLPGQWTHMGLWDLDCSSEKLTRKIFKPMLKALQNAQRLEKNGLLVDGQRVPLPREVSKISW